jgi:MFS family permease
MVGCASVVFGFAHDFFVLDAARFAQGAAGALIWAGSLTWLISVSPADRRGAVIGTTLGTAVAGALLGPALGALAAQVGTEQVFSGVLVIALILASFAWRLPQGERPKHQAPREVFETILSRPILTGTAFVAVPSVMFGAVEVLAPLRMADLGGGHTMIAAGFIAGAALEGILAPVAGGYSDRIGRRAPYAVGLFICAVALFTVSLGATLDVVLAGVMLTSLGGGICFTPALTMLSELAEESRLHQGFAAGLSNMAWAAGQVAGGLIGGAAASVAGNAAPGVLIGALLLVTVAYSLRALAPPPIPTAESGG